MKSERRRTGREAESVPPAGLQCASISFMKKARRPAGNFGMHPHVMGQPFRIRALREFIEYAAAHKDVWFASREAVASWYLQNHQSHIPTAS